MEKFFDSNLFQTIIMIVTVIVTLGIYFANKRQNIKNAATILSLQIKDIENNIDFLIAEGVINGFLQEKPLHYSTIIFEENYWSKYNHLIAGRVDTLTFETIDNFYKIASKIKEQQLLIKNKISQSMEHRTTHYYNSVFSRVNVIFDRIGKGESSEGIIESCKKEISIVTGLYSDGENSSIINHPVYVQTEFVNGLTKMLDGYKKLSEGVAYRKLLKL